MAHVLTRRAIRRRSLVREPLSRQVARHLRHEVRKKYAPGDRLPPELALAEAYGVSLVTIREAVLMLMQEGLLERRHGSGIYALAPPRQREIALYTEMDLFDAHVSPFYLRVFQHVRACLAEKQEAFRLYIGTTTSGSAPTTVPTCEEFLEDVDSDRVSGLLAVATLPQARWFEPLQARGVPMVGSGPEFRPALDSDYDAWLDKAAAQMAAAGRRRVALFAWDPNPVAVRHPGAGWEGAAAAAFARHGLEFHPELVRIDPILHPCLPGAGWELFRDVWCGSRDKPDGLIVCDDMYLQDVCMAILELGIQVPKELTVVTHANLGSPVHTPFPVTRIAFDPREFARTMVQLLLATLAGQTVPAVTRLAPRELPAADAALVVPAAADSGVPATAGKRRTRAAVA